VIFPEASDKKEDCLVFVPNIDSPIFILLLILPNIFGNKVIWMVSFLSEVLTIFICIYLLKKIKREGILS